jgi:cytoskeleton protein RodZ
MRRPAAQGTGASGNVPDVARLEKSLEAMGQLLKTKREINGLTRRDIVVKIKIPLDQLEAIEDGRLSTLPPVFAKGFLRAYANELGLDAETLLDDSRKMTGGFKNEPASREPLAPRYVETSVGSIGWRPGPRLIVAGALLVAAIAVGFWLQPGWRSAVTALLPGGSEAETAAPPTIGGSLSRPPSEGETVPAEPPAEPVRVDTAAAEEPPAETAPEVAAVEPATEAPVEPAPLPVLSSPTSLTLTSTKNQAWAEVTVDGGNPEFFWFARAGESAKVIASESIVVASGTAKDLLVLWDGEEELGPLSQTTATTVRVRFPK